MSEVKRQNEEPWFCSTEDNALCVRTSDVGHLHRSAWKQGIDPVELDVDYEGTVINRKFFRITLKGVDGLVDMVTGSLYAVPNLQCATNSRLLLGLLQRVPTLKKVALTPAEEKTYAKLFRPKLAETA